MVSLGVTTVECKSGYGLDREHELALLQVYRTLAGTQPVRLVPTFLGAHVVPPEFHHDRAGYLALLIDDLLPQIARERLAAFCDVFVERSAFTVEEARRLLLAARVAGLGAKLHADQLSQGGGAELAAEVGAVSADHLECASESGIAAMARAGVVAVSLPLASLYLGQAPVPARRWIEAGVAVAVATDFNPGSAPSYHLPVRADAGLHAPADDARGSAQGGNRDRGAGGRTGGAGRVARAGQGRPTLPSSMRPM